jgi:erythromycin esterase
VRLLPALLLAACSFSDIPGFQPPSTGLPIDTTPPAPPQDVAAWLRDSSVTVRSLDFADTDFRDLEPLRAAIGERRLVLLGEQSRGDGTTLRAKARLVRFLHEAMGFDVLVFESGLFDLHVAGERIAAGADPVVAVREALAAEWRSSAELSPLFRWLGERAQSTRPLRLAGLDPRFTGPAPSAAAAGIGASLEAYLRRYASPLPDAALWPGFRAALEAIARAGEAGAILDGAPRAAFDSGLVLLRAETNRLVNVAPEPDAAFWREVIAALGAQDRWRRRVAAGQLDTATTIREEAMAEALVVLAQSIHAGRRLVVWTGSAQALRTPLELFTVGGAALTPPPPRTFGEHARQILGDDAAYAIGFLAGTGSYGPFAGQNPIRPLVRPLPESWDGLFLASGKPFAFLDLRRPPTTDNAWIFATRVARPLGYQQMLARWPRVFDAFFFTAEMAPTPSTP